MLVVRKRKPKAVNYTEDLQIVMSGSDRLKLEAISEELNCSLNEVVRRLIRAYQLAKKEPRSP